MTLQINNRSISKVIFLLGIGFAIVLAYAPVQGQSGGGWLDPAWQYRNVITITNSGGTVLTGFQVHVTLDSSFDFANAKSDGSDIRFTAADGTTLIPFWIETWNPGTQQCSIWVKVPTLLAGETTVFLYYGNPSSVIPPSSPTEGPPTGPFTRAPGNPIRPIGDPGIGMGRLAENIVYDDVTRHYWMVFATDQGLGLMWSDNPADPATWYWYGIVRYTGGGSLAPHLLKHNGTWYLFFSDWSGPYYDRHNIVVTTATSITGPYTTPMVVLSPDPGTWENWRVDEPYVFQRNDGKWIMMYMGDQTGDVGPPTERVGYAYADNILGPYTKYPGNPVLDFGPPFSIDAGTIADPWVFEFQGTYYIGYTVSSTQFSPWQTAYATTTDWQTFTKHGILFPLATSGWDAVNSFRGAVTRIGDTYVLSYTGGQYQMGIATQPVVRTPPNIVNNADGVFDFYDGFDGTSLDTSKWSFSNGSSSQAVQAGGQLTLTATSSSFVRIRSRQVFGMDYIVEARGRHPQQGILNMVAEVGLIDGNFGDIVRIVDDFPGSLPTSTVTWNRQAKLIGQPDVNWVAMAQAADQQWHTFRVYRKSPNVAGFQVDENPVEEVSSNVPTSNLPAFLMSYTGGANNQFLVDWIRVRKFAYPEPVATVETNSSNHPPEAIPQTVMTSEDTPLSITLTGTDVDGDTLTYAVVIGPVHGTLSGQAPNLTYMPVANYNGPDSFRFKVNDGEFDSAPATVTIMVTAGPPWFDPAWNYRRAVTISNPSLSPLTNYQVRVTLNSSFDFANAKSDGSDIRFTAADGTTLIPSWIESWNPGTQEGSIWVRIPTLPTGGATVFLYYGNPNPVVAPFTPEAVFDFYDGFDGSILDTGKWSFANGSSSQAVQVEGELTLTGTRSSFIRIRSRQNFGMNYVVEARARHPQQGILNMVAEVGWIDANFGDIVRIVDDFHPSLPTSTITWNRQAKRMGQPDVYWVAMAQNADQQWHTFRVYRKSPNVAGFQIDESPVEEVSSNVPTSNLPVFLMSYTEGANNQFVVDWIRVRKFAYPEPVATLDGAGG